MSDGERTGYVGPLCRHGKAPALIRESDGKTRRCSVRPVREGEPLPTGSTTLFSKRADGSYAVDDIEVDGPAMVNSAAFRDGWDNIFGAAPAQELPN